jgi:hypothetical protein
MLFGDFLELRYIHQKREFVEMEHRLVAAVLAEKRDVLAEVHVLEMISDETPVTPLDAFPEFV